MLKTIYFLLTGLILIYNGCSNEDSNPTVPASGEVLLASVSSDSVGVVSGYSSRTFSITSGTLNFSDRDSARISFYYSGDNNNLTDPFQIYYSVDTNNIILYSGNNLTISESEQFINITLPSPKVNQYFKYTIKTGSSPGFSYFKFRDLNIYKK